MLVKKNKKINSNKFATNKNLTATFIQLLRTKTIKNKTKNKYREKNHGK